MLLLTSVETAVLHTVFIWEIVVNVGSQTKYNQGC